MILIVSVISPHTLSFVSLPICYLLPFSWVLNHSIISPSALYYFLSKTFSYPRSSVLRLYFLVSMALIRLVNHGRNQTVKGYITMRPFIVFMVIRPFKWVLIFVTVTRHVTMGVFLVFRIGKPTLKVGFSSSLTFIMLAFLS